MNTSVFSDVVMWLYSERAAAIAAFGKAPNQQKCFRVAQIATGKLFVLLRVEACFFSEFLGDNRGDWYDNLVFFRCFLPCVLLARNFDRSFRAKSRFPIIDAVSHDPTDGKWLPCRCMPHVF